MSRSNRMMISWWRTLMLVLIAALLLLVIGVTSGCSSGDDGRFVGDGDGEAIILPTYGYQISATPVGGPLTVSVSGEGGVRTVTIDFGNTLNGEVNVSVDINNFATITDYSLQSLSTLAIDSDAGIPFLGAFDIEVTEDMQILVGDPPTTGALEVITATETVSLRPVMAGVELRFGGAAPVIFTWDELENLLDDDLALAWQRRASLAAEILEFVFVQALSVTEVLNLVDDQLAVVNPLVASCDTFTGAPPPNVLAQGESTFTWMGTGSVPMGGDNFQWAFTDCWFDDSIDSDDELLNGSIDLNNYVEVIDANFNLIGTGFDEVIFNNLTIDGTVENPPGTFMIDPNNSVTVSGGFDLAYVGIIN